MQNNGVFFHAFFSLGQMFVFKPWLVKVLRKINWSRACPFQWQNKTWGGLSGTSIYLASRMNAQLILCTLLLFSFLFSSFGCIKCLNMQQASSKDSLTSSCFQQHFHILNVFLVDWLSNFSRKFPADWGSPLDTHCMYLNIIFSLFLIYSTETCFPSGQLCNVPF